MKIVTCIEDLRAARPPQGSARLFRLCRQRLLHRGDAARQPRRPRERSSCASACWSTCRQRSLATTIVGEKVAAPIVAGAGRAAAACSTATAKSSPRARPGGRHSVHALDHVDLLDRGRRGGGRASRSGSSSTSSRDRGFIRELIRARAQAAKCSALVLTVDLQVLGQRHRDIKNGMTVPPEIRLANIIDIAHQAGLGAGASSRASARPSAISPAT